MNSVVRSPRSPPPTRCKSARAGDIAPPRTDRSLVRVQTPQAFRALPLLTAYRAAEREGFDGTDTSSCIQRFTDVEVHAFDGHPRNLKVTYARDVLVAERLLLSAGRPDESR